MTIFHEVFITDVIFAKKMDVRVVQLTWVQLVIQDIKCVIAFRYSFGTEVVWQFLIYSTF